MKISSEFSKYAKEYATYNIIQNKVIRKLLHGISSQPQKILDLGCGSGAVINTIDWSFQDFLGVDFAQGMLDLHPKTSAINTMYGDFNDKELFNKLKEYKFDYIFSSSALQWAESLENVFINLKSLDTPFALAIFTSGTFSTLYKIANLEPLLRDSKAIETLANKYFDVNIECIQYRLEFDSVREMFRYIKKSGVSAGRNVLSYKQTKKLMNEYPLNYLEFEVVFITQKI